MSEEPRGSQSSPDKAPEELRLSTDDWAARARSDFGVSPHVLRGAMESSTRETHSEAQVRDAVAKYRKGVRAPDGVEVDS